jgi:hypothetical protein
MAIIDCAIACGISSVVVFCLCKSCEQEIELPPEEPNIITDMTRV